jgi:signal transduction histidine kinase
LGLTMVRRIVDRHNGWTWVQSEEDKGSLFFVALPMAMV